MGRAASVLLVLALCACSSPGSSTPTATGATSQLPAGTVSASGPWTFIVDSSSKTTVRVREVLAQIRAPGDAVLTATGMKGSFTLNTNGSFSPESQITADLTTLRSDESRRDDFIKDNTLDTRRFPTAEFVPKSVSGAALPLPLSGEIKFTLVGTMTLHGKSKDATFSVTARREGSKLTATAVAEPPFTFGDFGMTQPRVASVLSIEDEIRVEISLVAVETG
jgi:polyisoprenoid-binding protein YceI